MAEELFTASIPKWFHKHRKNFEVHCGGPKGVFTLYFKSKPKILLGKFEELLRKAFSIFPNAIVSQHKNIRYGGDSQEIDTGHEEGKLVLPEWEIKQPACVEVRIPNATPHMVALTVNRLFDVIDNTIDKLTRNGLAY